MMKQTPSILTIEIASERDSFMFNSCLGARLTTSLEEGAVSNPREQTEESWKDWSLRVSSTPSDREAQS